MDKAIEEFKSRRARRLDQRFGGNYQKVVEFRKRRAARLDEKKVDDEEGRWVTTENNHKVHINEEGEPDKGNPHVIEKMTDGDNSTENSGDGTTELESKNKGLKDNWLKGKTSERAKRYWEFLEGLPVGTVLTDGADEYKKTGADEYTVEEYGDVLNAEDMLDEANFSFDDFVPQIKALGDEATEARPFPEEIGEEYDKAAEKEAIRKSATAFDKVVKGKKEAYGKPLYNPKDFNAALEVMNALPVGSVIGNDYSKYIKIDGAWEDTRTGRKIGQFEATISLLDLAEFSPIKVDPPGEVKTDPLSERQKYHIAKRSAEEIASYRNSILSRASGKPDYDDIKEQLDAYCDVEKYENASNEAKANYIAQIEDRNRKTLERIKSPKDIKTTEDATNYLRARGYFKGDPIEIDENVNLSGMHTDLAVGTAAHIDSLFSDYPFLKGNADGLLCLGKGSGFHDFGDREAYAYADGKTVVFSEEFYRDGERLRADYSRDVEGQFHPEGVDYNSIVDHEFTHVMEKILNEKLDGKRASDIIMGRVAQRRFDLDSPEDIEREYEYLCQASVSRYSVENKGTEEDEYGKPKNENYGRNTEFLAEAISAARCSKTPNKTMLLAKEEFDKLVKEVFG